MAQIAEAVAHAHAAPGVLLHRDLKPANNLLDDPHDPQNACATDFSVAPALAGHSRACSEKGTYGYGTLEVWAGRGATAASDVYGLGVIQEGRADHR